MARFTGKYFKDNETDKGIRGTLFVKEAVIPMIAFFASSDFPEAQGSFSIDLVTDYDKAKSVDDVYKLAKQRGFSDWKDAVKK